MPVGSVIIVTHNSGSCIEACLQAIANHDHWKIILVDNCSTDCTLQKVRQVGRQVFLLQNAQNAGFARAVNQGAEAAEGDVFVIMNPDAIACPGALKVLADALAAQDVGAAGGQLVQADGRVQRGFTIRRFPTLGSMLTEVLLLNRVWPTNPWNRRYRCLDMDYTITQEVEQPAGACLAVKRLAWEDLGGFDESFFPVWFEDVDFCRRLRDRRWKILYMPEAVFTHAGGHSVNKLTFRDQQSFWYKNLLHYFAKHCRRWELKTLRMAAAMGLVVRALLSLTGFRVTGVSVAEAVSTYCHVAWHYALKSEEL